MIIGHKQIIDCNDVNPGLLMLDAGSLDGLVDGDTIKLEHTTTSDIKTYVNLETSTGKQHWGGGTVIEERNIPVVFEDIYNAQQQQIHPEDMEESSTSSTSSSVAGRTTTARRSTAAGRKLPGRRVVKDEDVPPEEMERLLQRRERNKEAAARCRKRKLDQIESLEKQVNEWESKNSALQKELIELKNQRNELQSMLHEHNTICRLQQQQQQQQQATVTTTAAVPPTQWLPTAASTHPQSTSGPILRVPNVAAATATTAATVLPHNHTSVAAATTSTTTTNNNNTNNMANFNGGGGNGKVVVKTEVGAAAVVVTTAAGANDAAPLFANHQTTEEMLNNSHSSSQQPQQGIMYTLPNTTTASTSTLLSSASPNSISAAAVPAVTFGYDSVGTPVTAKRTRLSRPVSLSLSVKPQNLRSIEGVPIETPTNIFNSLNFDALMDGRTGLTPTNIITPVSITMTSLSTPVLSSPTCSSQQQRSGGVTGLPGPDKNVKLVSL